MDIKKLSRIKDSSDQFEASATFNWDLQGGKAICNFTYEGNSGRGNGMLTVENAEDATPDYVKNFEESVRNADGSKEFIESFVDGENNSHPATVSFEVLDSIEWIDSVRIGRNRELVLQRNLGNNAYWQIVIYEDDEPIITCKIRNGNIERNGKSELNDVVVASNGDSYVIPDDSYDAMINFFESLSEKKSTLSKVKN